ncbi:50S ribosomal protein L32 [Tuwongella immobilis]|uniref:50S ribosomal protein L32 n=1 Tax=Tuwongella immobilis TaxID=692036 RepID=UPI0013A6C435
MAVPKRRTSHAKQGHRRSHHFVVAASVQYCGRCGSPVKAHTVCYNCGWSNSQKRELIAMGYEQEK